jgi:hypothetical protein
MRRVFETAWREIQAKYFLPSSDDTNQFGIFVAHRIIAAAAGGERDPERLKAAALQGFEAFPALSETDPADIVRSSVHINFSNGMNDHAASSGAGRHLCAHAATAAFLLLLSPIARGKKNHAWRSNLADQTDCLVQARGRNGIGP